MCSAVKFFYVSLFQTYNIIAKESSYYLYIFKETVHDQVTYPSAASPIHYGTIFINEEDSIDFYYE